MVVGGGGGEYTMAGGEHTMDKTKISKHLFHKCITFKLIIEVLLEDQ